MLAVDAHANTCCIFIAVNDVLKRRNHYSAQAPKQRRTADQPPPLPDHYSAIKRKPPSTLCSIGSDIVIPDSDVDDFDIASYATGSKTHGKPRQDRVELPLSRTIVNSKQIWSSTQKLLFYHDKITLSLSEMGIHNFELPTHMKVRQSMLLIAKCLI